MNIRVNLFPILCLVALICMSWIPCYAQSEERSLTPLQLEIEQQRQRLSSSDVEERRDAVMRLGSLRHPEASQAAVAALRDSAPIVRATATVAVLSLPGDESALQLLQLANDRNEFVRRETAYALGITRSQTAIEALVRLLTTDREDGVRGAAAVALGQIGDESAVVPLANVIAPTRRSRRERNAFVLMAAARSLGQIGSRVGVPALIATLEDRTTPQEVRREAAIALGLIGDPAARRILVKVVNEEDPYIARTAHEALSRIAP